jgi:hypothetical protein
MSDIYVNGTLAGNFTKEEVLALINKEGRMEHKTGTVNNKAEYTEWDEWYLDGKLIQRNVNVTLKPLKNEASQGGL